VGGGGLRGGWGGGGGGGEKDRAREISTSGAEDDFEIGCLSPQ